MKIKLLYWLDRMIYLWGDTMPQDDSDRETTDAMTKELAELKRIRKWVSKL